VLIQHKRRQLAARAFDKQGLVSQAAIVDNKYLSAALQYAKQLQDQRDANKLSSPSTSKRDKRLLGAKQHKANAGGSLAQPSPPPGPCGPGEALRRRVPPHSQQRTSLLNAAAGHLNSLPTQSGRGMAGCRAAHPSHHLRAGSAGAEISRTTSASGRQPARGSAPSRHAVRPRVDGRTHSA
jgi:hypothetical protein